MHQQVQRHRLQLPVNILLLIINTVCSMRGREAAEQSIVCDPIRLCVFISLQTK